MSGISDHRDEELQDLHERRRDELILSQHPYNMNFHTLPEVQPNQTFMVHEQRDNVNAIKPNYYKATIKGVEIDVIDIIHAFGLSFCLGNALKYILRAGKKDDRSQDLSKAGECLKRELNDTGRTI